MIFLFSLFLQDGPVLRLLEGLWHGPDFATRGACRIPPLLKLAGDEWRVQVARASRGFGQVRSAAGLSHIGASIRED